LASEHAPPMQKLDAQSPPPVQGEPTGCGSTQTPPTHTPDRQENALVQADPSGSPPQ
jgi:hypothetical protein